MASHEEDTVAVDEPELISDADRDRFIRCINEAVDFDTTDPEWKALFDEEQKKNNIAKSKSITPTKMASFHLHYETTQKTRRGSEEKLVVWLAKHRKNKIVEALARVSYFAAHARSKTKAAKKTQVDETKVAAFEAEKKAKEAKKAADELAQKPINLGNAVANAFAAPKKIKRSSGAKRDGEVAEPIGVGNDATKLTQAKSNGDADVKFVVATVPTNENTAMDMNAVMEAARKQVAAAEARAKAAEEKAAAAEAKAAAEARAKAAEEKAAADAKVTAVVSADDTIHKKKTKQMFIIDDDGNASVNDGPTLVNSAPALPADTREVGLKHKADTVGPLGDTIPSPAKKPRFDRDRTLPPTSMGAPPAQASMSPSDMMSELRISV